MILGIRFSFLLLLLFFTYSISKENKMRIHWTRFVWFVCLFVRLFIKFWWWIFIYIVLFQILERKKNIEKVYLKASRLYRCKICLFFGFFIFWPIMFVHNIHHTHIVAIIYSFFLNFVFARKKSKFNIIYFSEKNESLNLSNIGRP